MMELQKSALFIFPSKERVKKSDGFHRDGRTPENIAQRKIWLSNNTSSFPRKRESVCGVSVRKNRPVLRTVASRFPLSSVWGNRAALVVTDGSPRYRHCKDNTHRIIFRHSRESGNPEAVVRNVGPVFLTETPQRDSRFRGNDEVLSYGYCLPLRHFFGVPTVVMRAVRFFTCSKAGIHCSFPQNKTGRYCGRPPPDSRFRGNDEYL